MLAKRTIYTALRCSGRRRISERRVANLWSATQDWSGYDSYEPMPMQWYGRGIVCEMARTLC